MELGLKGKKAIVTGGATGIGKAIALALAQEGVKVAITSRKQETLDKALQELGGKELGHAAFQCNITDEDGPTKLCEKIISDFGNPDIVVNNVGDTLGVTDPYCSIAEWRKIFRLNVEVHVEINNFFIPFMRSQRWGRILNISAGASLENSGPVPYCSTKAALTAYTRSMGRILAPDGVVMSVLLPGVVITEDGHWANVLKTRPEHAEKYLKERCPMGRFGTVDEISPMAVLLCSELASFCVGSIVPVEGGQAKHFFNYSD
jgi:3-oxoacyl-[acyl-carrier protein] reductase